MDDDSFSFFSCVSSFSSFSGVSSVVIISGVAALPLYKMEVNLYILAEFLLHHTHTVHTLYTLAVGHLGALTRTH